MRIAQIAPLFESVPPKLYGGTERVVSYLTEELVHLGHQVTLFASGDSTTEAELVSGAPQALRLADRVREEAGIHIGMLKEAYAQRHDFDIFHMHIDDWHLREPRILDLPHLTTIHGRIDLPDRIECFAPYQQDLSLASISNAQRLPLPNANWVGTVHHGLPPDLYHPRYEPGKYLAFLGRISPEKRVDRAIDIAKRFGMKLKIAAKVDEFDREYYASLAHKFTEPCVEFVGEVDEPQKNELLGNAYALLFPIDWPEPFGLAVVEAMTCGTPIIAWPHGSVPEIVDDGTTGFLVNNTGAAIRALKRVAGMDRRKVARVARDRFSTRRMAMDYLRLYESCMDTRTMPVMRMGSGGGRHAGPRK